MGTVVAAVVAAVVVVDVVVVGLKAEVRAEPVRVEKNDILQSPPHLPFDPSPPQALEHSESETFLPMPFSRLFPHQHSAPTCTPPILNPLSAQ